MSSRIRLMYRADYSGPQAPLVPIRPKSWPNCAITLSRKEQALAHHFFIGNGP